MRCNQITQLLILKIASLKNSFVNLVLRQESHFAIRGIKKTDFLSSALLSLIFITFISADLSGQTTFTANNTGNWTTVTWIKTGPSLAAYPGQPGFGSEIHDVVILGAGITVTLNASITSSVRNVNINTGALDISSMTLTMTGNLTGGGSLTFTSGTINLAGNNLLTGPFSAGSGTMNYYGNGGQIIRGTTYYHLSTSGPSTKVLQGPVTINGNLTVTAGSTLQTNQFQITGNATGTLTMSSGTSLLIGNTASATDVSFPTNFTTPNISLHSNSTVVYQAGTSQTISAEPVYGHLTTATTGTKTLAGNIIVNGNLIIGMNTTVDLSSNDYSISLGGSWITYGVFNENQGKVILNGSSTQSIINTQTGSETFYDLEFNTMGLVIATCNLAVSNNLSLTNGVVLMPGKILLLGSGASNPGSLNHSSGWVYGTFSRWAVPAQSGTDLLFPVGDNNYGRSMTLNFAGITTAGILSINFTGTAPSTSGLPLAEGLYIFNLLFPEGYWNLTKDATFAFNGTYDLKVVPAAFNAYTVDENTRIVSRATGDDWFLNGTHVEGSASLLQRDDLTLFSNDFAVAYAEICNSSIINCPGDVIVNNQPGTCGNNVIWIPPVISPACMGDTLTSNYDPGDYFNVGTHKVVYYLRNGITKKDSCEFLVVVNDNEIPVVSCKNINLYLGALGTATINGTDIDNGSADNCSLILVPDRTDFSCADAGSTIPVRLVATDPSGNSGSCFAQVTVLDTISPVINTKTHTVLLDATGNGTLQPSDVDNGTFDNCGAVTLSVSPDSFNCSDQGLQTVIFTAQDASGNTSVSPVQITVQSSLVINSTSLSSCDLAGPYALYESDVSGGDGNYSYFWDGLDDSVDPFISFTGTFPFIVFSNTSTSETPFFNNLMPDGLYTIRLIVTDGNNCRDTMDMVITKSGFMFNNITIRYSATCEGSTVRYTVNYDTAATYNWGVENGTIITSPLDTNSVEVLWNVGVTQGVIISTAAKTNILGEPCESTVVDTVAISPLPQPVFDNPATEVCVNSEVTYTLTQLFSDYTWIVSGGSITGGGTGNSFVRVRWGAGPAGMVAVSVESGEGCSSAVFMDIFIYNLSGSVTSLKNVSCNGLADGEVTVAATAGTGKPPYEYSLDTGAFQVSGTFTGLGPGLHSVLIRDDLSCTFNVSFTVTQPPLLTATVTKTDILCYGMNTGTITAAGSGGSAPYTYSLDGSPFSTSGSFTGLAAGSHTLIVRDANMCTFPQNIVILQPTVLTGSAAVTSAIPCSGGTATVTLTGSGGTAPLSYTFNGVTNPTGIFSGIPAGSGYSWSITDANNCGPVSGTLNVMQSTAITGSASVTSPILCSGGTATVTITGSGGTAPLFYTFNGMSNGTGIFNGIPAGTSYIWSITDINGCGPLTGTLDVAEPSVITGSASVTAPVLCNGGTATITITGGGGTPPLSYTFNGVTNSTGIFSGIPAGTGYIWSITDANNCGSLSDILDVTEPVPVTGSAAVTAPILCSGGTATVTITASGGTLPLSYTFNGVTNATGIFGGIAAGTHAWSVTDVNLCTPATGTLDVTESGSLAGTITAQTNVSTYGGNDGSVTVEGSGGTPPYQYRLGSGPYQSAGTFTSLTAGSYIVTVQDNNLCTFDVPVTITQPPGPLTGAIVSQSEALCFGGNTGSVTVTGIEGVLPYEYRLNGGPWQSSGTFGSLVAGPYTITIRDAIMDTYTVPVTITEPPELTVSTTQVDVLCFGSATGSATAVPSGGVEPYTWSWNTLPVQTTATATGLSAATYTVTVTDANGCTTNASVTITQPAGSMVITMTQVNITCSGSSDGSADAAVAGGTAPYTYSWDTSPVQTTQGISGLAAGTYTVTITDFIGCTKTGTVTITEPQPLSLEGVPGNAKCPDSNEGTIDLTITGGTSPYTVIWSDGNTNAGRTGLLPGTYSVVVTDQNGCTASLDVTVGFDGTFECISFPKVITPNGDGKNDTWIIKNIDLYPGAEIRIFTRWGKLIFRTKNPLANPWDGTFDNGTKVPADSYHYILYLNDGSEPRSGVISVIR